MQHSEDQLNEIWAGLLENVNSTLQNFDSDIRAKRISTDTDEDIMTVPVMGANPITYVRKPGDKWQVMPYVGE